MIIQNKHYFTTFLLTSESKCNFRATNPALNCDLLCLERIADSLNIPPELRLGHRAIHPCPRGRTVAGNFSASMPAAISGLRRLVKSVIDD